MIMLILGCGLITAGWVVRDLKTASSARAMVLWRKSWTNRLATGDRHSLGSVAAIAKLVGDAGAAPAMLNVIAEDISANEWVPSDPLLDQLRRWADSQVRAAKALDRARPQQNSQENTPDHIRKMELP
jgi:hypothetical protein